MSQGCRASGPQRLQLPASARTHAAKAAAENHGSLCACHTEVHMYQRSHSDTAARTARECADQSRRAAERGVGYGNSGACSAACAAGGPAP